MPQVRQNQAAVFNAFGGLNTNADPHDPGTKFAVASAHPSAPAAQRS